MTNLKKVLLASAAITLLSGAAFAAGNNATSNSTGDSNETTINQTSSSNGLGHTATSDVSGTRNLVLIDQNSQGQNSGTANVTVTGANGSGDYNDVNVSQGAFQSQNGGRTEQKAKIDVSGNRNDIDTVQRYGSDGSSVNQLTIAVHSNAGSTSEYNDIDVNQSQNGNAATTDVWGDRNTLSITQRGADTASIYVDGALPADEGSYNRVTVDQTYSPLDGYKTGGNKATARVYGNHNNESGNGFGNLGLTAGLLKQKGAGNTVDITAGTLNGVDANYNTFGTDQTGLSNTITGTILGERNTAGVKQNGDLNNVSFSQDGSFNVLSASQDGTNNILTSTQIGTGNTVTSSQTGMGNVANAYQNGTGNVTTITQNNGGGAL